MDRRARDFAPLSPRAVELLAELHRPATVRDVLLGREARDIAILQELAALAEPRLVVSLLDAVFAAPNAVARAATQTVAVSIARIPITQLPRLEIDCRRRSAYSSPYQVAWSAATSALLDRFWG